MNINAVLNGLTEVTKACMAGFSEELDFIEGFLFHKDDPTQGITPATAVISVHPCIQEQQNVYRITYGLRKGYAVVGWTELNQDF